MTIESLGSRRRGCNAQLQRACYAVRDDFVAHWGSRDGVPAGESFKRSEAVDGTLRYLTSSNFDELHSLILNTPHYILKDKELGNWIEMTKCR